MEHDFSRGPWWPEKTHDVTWSVEFLEHVNLQYHYNYVTALRKAALIFVTSSSGGGWHHVEVHSPQWWIQKFESYGFKYDAELTDQVKGWGSAGKKDYQSLKGQYFDGFYIRVTMKVFVNPVVAALPEHAHLFPEFGCYGGKNPNGTRINRKCNETYLETPVDKSMYPLKLTPEMHREWLEHVDMNVKVWQALGNVLCLAFHVD